MFTLWIVNRIETDDPDMISPNFWYVAAAELLIEAFIVSMLIGIM